MKNDPLLKELQANATYLADLGETIEVSVPETPLAGSRRGPTIYLCHYEAQYLVVIKLVSGGIDNVHAAATARMSADQAGDVLTFCMEELAQGKRTLTDRLRSLFAAASALYLSGTQTYRVAAERGMEQLLVISHYNVAKETRTIRPTATSHPLTLTPGEVSEVVLDTLKADRRNHPERFRQNVSLRFRPKVL